MKVKSSSHQASLSARSNATAHPAASKTASKRLRIEESTSDSEPLASDDKDDAVKFSKTQSKRSRVSGGRSNVPVQLEYLISSDDEPLMKRITTKPSSRCVYDTNLNPELTCQYVHGAEKPLGLMHTPPHVSMQPSDSVYKHSVRHDHMKVEEVKIPVRPISKIPTSKTSVYGRKKNLTKSFQSIGSAAKFSPEPTPFATKVLGHRRVSSEDQVFKSMRSEETDGLVSSKGKSKTGKGASNDSRTWASGSKKRVKGEVEKLLVGDNFEASQVNDVADADNIDYANIAQEDGVGGDSDDSDSTLVGDEGGEHTASLTSVERSRANNAEISQREKIANKHAHTSRTAGSNQITEVIDLTEDEDICAPSDTLLSPSKDADLSHTGHLILGSPLPERPKTTAEREAAFLKGFNTQWWAGGLSYRAATLSVNATLRPSIPRFSDVEGKRRLDSLFAQSKLAIRHELVYHLDCDPGVDAPLLSPLTPSKCASPVQQALRGCKMKKTPPHHSPFGKISGHRFHEFEGKLYSAVKVEKTLFQDCGETLERCAEALNEWMVKEKEFGRKEVRAAFLYLANQGKAELEEDVVKLLSLE